jgi:hypothetical protein
MQIEGTALSSRWWLMGIPGHVMKIEVFLKRYHNSEDLDICIIISSEYRHCRCLHTTNQYSQLHCLVTT